MQTMNIASADLFKDGAAPALELGMQELEAMEAPGFYTGFKDGLTFTMSVAGLSVAALT